LSIKRFFWEWYKSRNFSLKGGDPSFRVKENNIIYNNKIAIMTCKKNPLLFANPNGIHRRGDIDPNFIREAIHFDVRANAF
tara:strand:- start:427 stop:669 length:243 start_codon:yes stop_codon:yes gene_type:complete